MASFAIAHSAQSKRPRGSDRWVIDTVTAVRWGAAAGATLVTSVGLDTWELSLWAAASQGLPVHIVLPASKENDDLRRRARIIHEFELGATLVGWTTLSSPKNASRRERWGARDRAVLDMADVIFAGSIHAGGKIDNLLKELPASKVCHALRRESPRCRHYLVPWRMGEPGNVGPVQEGLLHLTRAASGKWPGERAATYYAALIYSGDSDPRSGFETLRNIVREGTIRGSAHRISGGERVVCWTSLDPKQALRLVRPRIRFARWSLEPYGVWVSSRAAKQLGARAVVYGLRDPTVPQWLRHAPGTNGLWLEEREWRNTGDAKLTQLDEDEVEIWTATDAEAEILRRESQWRVRSFGFPQVDISKTR